VPITAVSEPPLVEGRKTLGQVTADVLDPLEGKPTRLWWIGLGISGTMLLGALCAIGYVITTGIGALGLTKTIGWGFLITNFVFWVGIGHAGTLISAILLLLRQRWRTAINRSAEAMTIFALCCAGIFPLMHMGRPWLFFWLLAYPNTRGPVWPNFRSPLLWDMFAISTYFIVSLVFWFLGLMPDFATLRDRVKGRMRKAIFGTLSLGWNGSARAWERLELVSLLLAGLATPLVLSVHSLVSCDFATSLLPGWHATILPPYFVAGAILSGFSMVITLMLVARKTMRFEAYITQRHIDAMCKVVILTSMLVGMSYLIEIFVGWYSGDRFEQFMFLNRFLGPLGWSAWIMYGCNMLVPQLLWFPRVRNNHVLLFVLSLLVNVGMWFERFVIIVVSLSRDFLPSSWSMYHVTPFDYAITFGCFGLFFTLFLLFCRALPMIAMAEIKHELAVERMHGGGHG